MFWLKTHTISFRGSFFINSKKKERRNISFISIFPADGGKHNSNSWQVWCHTVHHILCNWTFIGTISVYIPVKQQQQ